MKMQQREFGVINIGGVKLNVTNDQYIDFYAEVERMKYIQRQERGRKISLETLTDDDIPFENLLSHTQLSVEDEAVKNVLIGRMMTLISQMDIADQKLIQLLFYHELSLREAAQKFGVNESTIRFRRDKLLRLLRRSFGMR